MRKRILIADDHALVRKGLHAILESHADWEVCGEARNGTEAVQKAIELEPDVVVMDISMPGLSGLQATRQIREALPETEVLVLTMHESHEMIRAAYEAGACGYAVKSDPDHNLIQALESVCRHEPHFPGMRSVDPPGNPPSRPPGKSIDR